MLTEILTPVLALATAVLTPAQYQAFDDPAPQCESRFAFVSESSALDADMVNRLTITRDNTLIWNYETVSGEQFFNVIGKLADYTASHPEQVHQIIVDWEAGADCPVVTMAEEIIVESGLCESGQCSSTTSDMVF